MKYYCQRCFDEDKRITECPPGTGMEECPMCGDRSAYSEEHVLSEVTRDLRDNFRMAKKLGLVHPNLELGPLFSM